MCGTDSTVCGSGPVPGCCEHGNESSGYVKSGKFLDKLSDYQFLKKDSASWDYYHHNHCHERHLNLLKH
jgi:hypothetical protein